MTYHFNTSIENSEEELCYLSPQIYLDIKVSQQHWLFFWLISIFWLFIFLFVQYCLVLFL